jgi:hypothetical protein
MREVVLGVEEGRGVGEGVEAEDGVPENRG